MQDQPIGMDDPAAFETIPTNKEVSPDQLEKASEWTEVMNDAPAFVGESFGGNDKNNELAKEGEFNESINAAAAILNYGLDTAAVKYGVESTIRAVKYFDLSSSNNPIQDLLIRLGVDSKEKSQELRNEKAATKSREIMFYEGKNAPASHEVSREGAIKAIEDLKELIAEVEGADPAYRELRDGARVAKRGVFEFAVSKYPVQGLSELFSELQTQRKEKADEQMLGSETEVGTDTTAELGTEAETEAENAAELEDAA